jgi:hypothetical protein
MGAFQQAVESGDAGRIVATLADDVTFRSPAVHQPYSGRETVGVILTAVVRVLEDFRYVDTIAQGEREMLRFAARVGSREIDGVDIVRYDDAGQVSELSVMVRPLSALNALREAMAAELGLIG